MILSTIDAPLYPMPLWAHEYPLSHLGRSTIDPSVWKLIDYHNSPGTCWVWTGGYNKRDRLPVFDGGRSVRAYIFDALIGGRAARDVVGMTCVTERCVKVDHMRVRTRGDHLRK